MDQLVSLGLSRVACQLMVVFGPEHAQSKVAAIWYKYPVSVEDKSISLPRPVASVQSFSRVQEPGVGRVFLSR